MAKFQGILGGKITGKVGNLVFTQVAGVGTVAREYVAAPSNPRTEAQQSQRTKLANLVNFYRAFNGVLKGAFETKKASQSDYNAFVGKNIAANPIALTKQEAAAGAVVVAPYVMSEGSLPRLDASVVSVSNGKKIDLGLSVGGLDSLASLTIAGLSKALLSNNPWLSNGMQISVLIFVNQLHGTPAVPRAAVSALEFTIDLANTDSFANSSYFAQLAQISDGQLALNIHTSFAAFAALLSQKVGGTLKVSSSEINMVEDSLLLQYDTNSQRNLAAESYGESAEIFLSPGGGAQPVPDGDGDNNLE